MLILGALQLFFIVVFLALAVVALRTEREALRPDHLRSAPRMKWLAWLGFLGVPLAAARDLVTSDVPLGRVIAWLVLWLCFAWLVRWVERPPTRRGGGTRSPS